MAKKENGHEASSPTPKKVNAPADSDAPDVTSSASSPPDNAENAPSSIVEDRTVSTEDYDDGGDYDDDETDQGMPLLNYSRLFNAGLPRKSETVNDSSSSSSSTSSSTYLDPSCTCSELTVIRVDPEDLVPSTAGGSATHTTFATTATTTTSSSTSSSPILPQHAAASSTNTTTSIQASSLLRQQQQLLTSDLWQQPHLIMACGWKATNTVTLINVLQQHQRQQFQQGATCSTSLPVVIVGATSTSAVASDGTTGGGAASVGGGGSSSATIALTVREVESSYSVIDMSFDASGTVFGAIDEGGACTIWEMKYTATLQPNRVLLSSSLSSLQSVSQPTSRRNSASRVATTTDAAGSNNMFSGWMSALTGMPPSAQSHGSDAATGDSTGPSSMDDVRATLTAQLIAQPSRINYPSSWGPPTCMVLEPAFKRRREKSVLVGFSNGRLVLTKRGTFFQRRNDTVLYQAGNHSKDASDRYRGIETVAWRGSLVAWADSTGIKLLDMEQLTRIAHIDRPAGARPSLYPTVRDLHPTLFFETSNHLLVGWGDCLMQMQIDEHVEPTGTSGSGEGSTAPTEVKKRRTVQCTMAWELDCVACDAVPLDSNHIAVLGFVPLLEEDSNGGVQSIGSSTDIKNDVELQIVSRGDGSVSHCDALPLLRSPSQSGPDSALPYRLLSTFALPRMEDTEESKLLQSRLENGNEMGFVGIDVEFDLNQNLFSGADTASRRRVEYRDPHLHWNLDSIVDGNNGEIPAEVHNGKMANEDEEQETRSVDSDDYECILRPIESFEAWKGLNLEEKAPAPAMIVCSGLDAVVSIVSTIDDVIADALSRNKCALALKLGLRHRRQIRQYRLDELANRFIEAVLRIAPAGANSIVASSPLSLRRMQLAVKAMPILFGSKTPLWEKWTKELENIPGALFLARKYLPVRDPVLSASVYGRALEKMLMDSEQLAQSLQGDDTLHPNLAVEGSKHFLEGLTAWGTTKVLKEYIKFYKYSRDWRNADAAMNEDLKGVEVALQRRYMQTAAVYMQFPARDDAYGYGGASSRYDAEKDESQDSLFDISTMLAILALRAPLVSSDQTSNSELALSHHVSPNDQTSLEAIARLYMMQDRHDLALKSLLAIGAIHSPTILESLESRAIEIVNGCHSTDPEPPVHVGTVCYDYILILIESQHLNQCLLQNDFILSTDSRLYKPLIALLRLVGLQRLGEFLIEHCVASDFKYEMSLSEAFPDALPSSYPRQEVQLREPLPFDKVAKQFESSPALFYWYLHLVLTKRPEFYIKFPNNAVPPKTVTSLHRKHFQLYVDFAGELRDSTKALASTQQYNADSTTTPMLLFLKAALPLGGLLPIDARRALEIERSKSGGDEDETDDKNRSSSPLFALELAYIIENYGDRTENGALGILNLYLLGCRSLMLAVSFAQRQKQFSSLLWDKLTSFCTGKTSDGELFGKLLEAAAYSGADLARLVEQIPPGMIVEGLRPRLVAAVADYRMKLEIYTAATAAGSEEAIVLMREIAHRSRRGVRYSCQMNQGKSYAEIIQERSNADQGAIGDKIAEELPTALPKDLKIRPRQVHNRLSYSITSR